MDRSSHFQSNPGDLPLGDQIRHRLRAICELEEWPLVNAAMSGGPIVFRPWGDGDPSVQASTAVLSRRSAAGELKVPILLLSIHASIPRRVLDRYLNPICAGCARAGVNFAMEGLAPAPGSRGPAPPVGGVAVACGESSLDAHSMAGAESWERITLTIALTGHAINAECVQETLLLLYSGHIEVVKHCQKSGRT